MTSDRIVKAGWDAWPHPLLTRATGTGRVDVSVGILEPDYLDWQIGQKLLADLHGATVATRSIDGLDTLLIEVPSEFYDIEHDLAYLARIKVINFRLASFTGLRSVFIGTMNQAHLYPDGYDLAEALRGSETVPDGDSERYVAPSYLPPRRSDLIALLPSLVAVVVTPSGTE